MFRSFGRLWNQGQKVFKNFVVLHSEKAKLGIKRGKNEQNTNAFVPTKAGDSSKSLTRIYLAKYHRDSLAAELRKKAAWRFMGNFLNRNSSNLPIFAFVGLALAQNQSGNDSHDEVCDQIMVIESQLSDNINREFDVILITLCCSTVPGR